MPGFEAADGEVHGGVNWQLVAEHRDSFLPFSVNFNTLAAPGGKLQVTDWQKVRKALSHHTGEEPDFWMYLQRLSVRSDLLVSLKLEVGLSHVDACLESASAGSTRFGSVYGTQSDG